MSLTATSSLCKSYDVFRRMLAGSKWFQRLLVMPLAPFEDLALIGDSDTRLSLDRALERVVPSIFSSKVEGQAEPDMPHPFVITKYDVENSFTRSSSNGYERADSFEVVIELEAPPSLLGSKAELHLARYYDCLNKVGMIFSDWKAAGQTASTTSLSIETWQRDAIGQVVSTQSNGKHIWMASFMASFQGAC